jgi:hypothetical protein
MIYADDYGIVDTIYIALATTIDPCDEHDQPEYLIGLVLHVGHLGHVTSIAYPQRGLRDAAFEQIVALVKHEAAAREEEED